LDSTGLNHGPNPMLGTIGTEDHMNPVFFVLFFKSLI
jgi:hypothetical protein